MQNNLEQLRREIFELLDKSEIREYENIHAQDVGSTRWREFTKKTVKAPKKEANRLSLAGGIR